MSHNTPPWRLISQRIAALAVRQHGNVTREQLLALGCGTNAIAYWLKTGRIFRVHPGVYAVGRPPVTPLERAAAAVLACGPHAALSHRSAMVLWGIWERWEWPLHITLAAGQRNPAGIHVHRSRTLTPRDITTQRGIRVTTVARALLDVAPSTPPRSLTRAVNNARLANVLTLDQLGEAIARHPTHPGAKHLISFVEAGGNPTRSSFEDDLSAWCAEHDIPAPVLNAKLLGYEVDALFPVAKVIVECDGWATHRSRAAFESDRERDATMLAAGYVTVRITKRRLTAEEAVRLKAIIASRTA